MWTNGGKCAILIPIIQWEGCEILRVDVMGVGIDNLTKSEFIDRAGSMLREKHRGYCVTPNAEILYEAARDPSFRDVLNGAAMVLPDGAGVVLGAKILGTPIREKVAGIEFGEEICKLLADQGGRLFLLGGKPGIAEAAGENLKKKYPGLVICGTADGYFAHEAPVIRQINDSQPDVVFVCLGAPKQERFMAKHLAEVNAALLLGLGGSLDGYAGAVQRAPRWMIRWNLEWLYRLIQEPRRLGRMLRLPQFVVMCVKEKLHRRKNG